MRAERLSYEFCGLIAASDIPLPPLRRASGPAICSITVPTQFIDTREVRWFHHWRTARGRAWLSFGRLGSEYVLRFAQQLADFVVNADATRIAVSARRNIPADTLRHLLIDQVLPLVASRHGALSLHASAVHLAGVGTVAFVGEAGRGKSTLAAAFAARGGRIVADDCLAIDLTESGALAVPCYPGLRLFPGGAANALIGRARRSRVAHYTTKQRVDRPGLFHAERSPLRALFLLSPRGANGAAAAMRRCRPSTRFVDLLRFAYLLDVEDRRDLERVFTDISRVAATVPVMRLKVRNGRSHLPDAVESIRQFAANV